MGLYQKFVDDDFQCLFAPALEGEVIENQAPFRDGAELIFVFA